MSPRPATTGQLATGIVAGQVAVAAAGDGTAPPDWVKVTPRGEVSTRDGRTYGFDPETLTARFKADAVDVAVDTNHALALRGVLGESVDTLGYAVELQARADGTYARVNWLEPAVATATIRRHRYVSPTFYPDEAGRAVWLHSISLVAAPALSMPALLHAHGDPSESFMKQIAKALGLPETATEAECLAALGGRTETKAMAVALGLPATADAAACLSAAAKAGAPLKPIAAALGLAEGADEAACLAAIGKVRSGGNDALATLQADFTRTSAAFTALQKSVRDKDVAALIDGALKDRRAVPAERDHLTTLCATDEGLATVRAMLGARVPGLADSGLDARGVPEGGETDPATLAAKATKLQAERAAAGQPIGYAEAVALAHQTKA